MKNLGEKIEIGSGFREEDGTKLEPELQPVKRMIATEANAKHGEREVGAMPVTLTTEMPAIEAAEVLARQCHRCAHWRPEEWNWSAMKARLLAGGPDGHATLTQIRAEMLSRGVAEIPQLENGNGDFDDVDHAVASMGVCKAMTALAGTGDPVAAFPTATCPDGYDFFTPRAGGEMRRETTRIRDAILHTASKVR